MIYKNMPFFQLLLNAPLLLTGFLVKYLFFARKGFGTTYMKGLLEGIRMSLHGRKVPFHPKNLMNYLRIQLELWVNILRKVRD